jgi:hypothetical protein
MHGNSQPQQYLHINEQKQVKFDRFYYGCILCHLQVENVTYKEHTFYNHKYSIRLNVSFSFYH